MADRRPGSIRPAGIVAVAVVVAAAACGCSTDSALDPFTSDGCSLFPDASLISAADWCGCCVEHDVAYWKGGTAEERAAADARLRDCVVERTANTTLADAMYRGVRVGGSPYFYNWYRWGYGWDYERKYQALTQAEAETAAALLARYRAAGAPGVCD